MADLETIVGGLSDDQLLKLLNEVTSEGEEKKTEPAPQTVKVQLGDGTVLEAKTAEEMNGLLKARLEAEAHREESKPPVQNPQERPSWDLDIFAKKFVKDPREGLDYMDLVEFGAPTRKMVPVLAAVIATLGKRLEDLETKTFTAENPEFNPENRRIVEGIMRERGWQPSRQTMQDAFDIARARGMVKVEERKVEAPPQSFIPPRTPKTTSNEPEQSTEELVEKARTMPLEQLQELLRRGGILRST